MLKYKRIVIKSYEKVGSKIEGNSQIKKLYIRADMNKQIATGHIMRCISIANAAKEKGLEVVFICADENPKEVLSQNGFECIILNSRWDDLESEFEDLRAVIEGDACLLVDSYSVTYKYLESLREIIKVIYMDDLNSFLYPVDMVITYANYYKKWNIESQYELGKNLPDKSGDITKLLLGTKYVPLRSEFRNLPAKEVSDTVKKILIMSGGSDNYHIQKTLLKALVNSDGDYKLTAICGRYNMDYDELASTYENDDNVTILTTVNNLIDYIKESDLVITAGGTTLYEICACGTPAITYSFADNQLDNVLQFEVDELMPYAGDARILTENEGEEKFTQSVLTQVNSLLPQDKRKEKSMKMQEQVDGYGAARIVDEIIKL